MVISKELVQLFIHELGAKNVLVDKDVIEKYARDETSDLTGFPDIVVRAATTMDVSKTVALCNTYRVPLTPRGAGTGVTGGCVPVSGGVVLCLERFNSIVEIDRANMVAVVEPGAITGDIQNAVVAQGLMYPPDPASLENCSIGGNVAENAGGPRALKYGTTKDYILGLECVLADGSIIKTGGKTVKNVTGYNLTGMILGSEGTLAVITKIYLKLIPLPKISRDLLVPFDSLESAIEAVTNILAKQIMPATIEFMEEDAIKLVAAHLDSNVPFPDARAHLLIQLDGESDDALFRNIEEIAASINVPNENILIAENPAHQVRLWQARRSIREAIESESPVFLAEDCVVPRATIPRFLQELKIYFSERNLRSVMFGHAGDGNVHIDILKGEIEYSTWKNMIPALKRGIYQRALDRGGTITGEHGIGYVRKEFIRMALSSEEIELHKRIKHAFDPNHILNPGKIF